MKNLVVFYLIMMVLLSVLPCGDESEINNFPQNVISKFEPVKKESSTEACLAICACTCCGQSVVATTFINFSIEIPIAELNDPIAIYQFSLQQRPIIVWQPPKLAVNA